MIATALAKKYGLSGEEQRNLFKSGMFQPLSRSMVNMLAPQQYRTELTQGQTADPTVFLRNLVQTQVWLAQAWHQRELCRHVRRF